MIPYPHIKPEILEMGPLKIRWYGVMYVIAYFLGYQILKLRARMGLLKVNYRDCETLVTYLIFGMLIGARLAYVFIYNWDSYSQNPIEILYIWRGGLSFHGAMVGMVVACGLFARTRRIPWYMVTDSFALAAAPGLLLGRLGNFINGELYGRPSSPSLPWAMIFPTDPDQVPRHPSQLYQGLSEGLLLFCILWYVQKWALRRGFYRQGLLSAVFLMGYGIIRFVVEFTREPDAQLGFVLGPFSMGQILCFLTFLWGAFTFWHHRYTQPIFIAKAPTKEFLDSAG